jgi:hypothetical protein
VKLAYRMNKESEMDDLVTREAEASFLLLFRKV